MVERSSLDRKEAKDVYLCHISLSSTMVVKSDMILMVAVIPKCCLILKVHT